jgi:hypothetical protein
MSELKLAALDLEDLEIISAHMQDAVARLGDFIWLEKQQQFILEANRFVWEDVEGEESPAQRRRTGLSFSRVRAVKSRNLQQDNKDKIVNLLAIRFLPDSPQADGEDGPGEGSIELVFSDDCTLRLEVECIEVRMKDLGPVWAARGTPAHDPA